jgi:hypothetical protein
MDTPWSQPALGDFETTPFTEQHVFHRHTHVIENDFEVPVRRMSVTKHRQVTHDLDPRRVRRHDDHRLLTIRCRSGIGFAHQNKKTTMRVARTGRPPLATINNVLIAITPNLRLNIACIG